MTFGLTCRLPALFFKSPVEPALGWLAPSGGFPDQYRRSFQVQFAGGFLFSSKNQFNDQIDKEPNQYADKAKPDQPAEKRAP